MPMGLDPGMGNGIFMVFAVLIGGAILFSLLRTLFTTVENLGQDEVARPARIVAKRQSTSVSGGTGNMPASSHNHYHVTFEFGGGEREEFSVNGAEYGMLAEGDEGTLRSQGTWYKGFERMSTHIRHEG
ncbi:MAG: conserved domain protein histidine-rich [Firmicutes bacterium]|nr:conserved domain protein histidine-rich [Bacillota bacterium]